jgi:hypothetical protein
VRCFPAQEAATAARGKVGDNFTVAVGSSKAESYLPVGRDEGVIAVIGLEKELDEWEVADRSGELQRGAVDSDKRTQIYGLLYK